MLTRRRFIARGVAAAAGLSLGNAASWLRATPSRPAAGTTSRVLDFGIRLPEGKPDMVIVKGFSLPDMVRKAIASLGGMKSFISKGDRVVIKPNASWDRTPDLGANTHPEIVEAVTTLCFDAGASDVVAIDNTIGEPRRCFAVSGIGPAVKRAGGRIAFQGKKAFKAVDLGGAAIGRAKIMKPLFEADKFINIPIAKHHGLSRLTAAMKNLYGIIGGVRALLHVKLSRSIVDLASFARPTLVVLDAFSVMTRHGPSGGKPDDLIHPRTIAAGTDQVAIDALAASFLGLSPGDVGHIRLAHEKGLGEMNYGRLRVEKINL